MTAGADEVSLGRGDSGTSLRMRETLHRTAHCTGEPWRVTAASAKLLKQALASDRVRSGLSPAGGVWATPSPAAGRSRSGPRKPIVPGPGTRDRPRRLLSGREEPPGLPPRGVSEARATGATRSQRRGPGPRGPSGLSPPGCEPLPWGVDADAGPKPAPWRALALALAALQASLGVGRGGLRGHTGRRVASPLQCRGLRPVPGRFFPKPS